jgi:hypothetical protein
VTTVLVVVGVVTLTVTGVDVLWTVLAAGSGAGPVTARLSGMAWRVGLWFGRRPEGPRHALLAVFGVAIVAGMLLSWVAVAFGAWWLIASAADGAVRLAETGQPAGLLDRGYFVGFNLFTLGTTTYVAGEGLWQLLPVLTGANGLVALTLGISYLVPFASAVAERRQLAQYVLSLGATPEEVLARAWTPNGFGSLPQHLLTLTPMVQLAGERHLTYPALAWFHSAREHASSSISTVVLHDALFLLRHGVACDARPDPVAVEPLQAAVEVLLDTVAGSFVTADRPELPAPDLAPLRAAGIPTVDDGTFAAALSDDSPRRRILATLLADDGWTAEAWQRRRLRVAGAAQDTGTKPSTSS